MLRNIKLCPKQRPGDPREALSGGDNDGGDDGDGGVGRCQHHRHPPHAGSTGSPCLGAPYLGVSFIRYILRCTLESHLHVAVNILSCFRRNISKHNSHRTDTDNIFWRDEAIMVRSLLKWLIRIISPLNVVNTEKKGQLNSNDLKSIENDGHRHPKESTTSHTYLMVSLRIYSTNKRP